MKYHIDYSKIFYPVAHRPVEYIETFAVRARLLRPEHIERWRTVIEPFGINAETNL